MYRQTKRNIYERDKVRFKQEHQGHNLCVVIIKYIYVVKMKKEEAWDNWNDTYFIGKICHSDKLLDGHQWRQGIG